MRQIALALSVAAAVALVPAVQAAPLINAQFQNTLYAGPPAIIPYTGAAVLGGAGDSWNQINNPDCPGTCSITNAPLTDAGGAPTTAKLSFSDAVYFTFRTIGIGAFVGTPYETLLSDGIFSAPGYGIPPAVITISGLLPAVAYDLLLYSASTGSGVYATQFTVDGQSQLVQSAGATTLIQGDSYARFTATATAGGEIAISMLGVGESSIGYLNAIQVSQPDEVPEPGAMILLGTGLLVMARYRRSGRTGGR